METGPLTSFSRPVCQQAEICLAHNNTISYAFVVIFRRPPSRHPVLESCGVFLFANVIAWNCLTWHRWATWHESRIS
jgi:hypothetical protein